MSKKSFQHIMRALHRDIGYVVVGLTIIYAFSGILLIYRGTDFMKFEQTIERQLSPNLEESTLGRELRFRHFKIDKTENNIIYFNNGTYNIETGKTIIIEKRLPEIFGKMNGLHKKSNRSISHVFSTIYGVLLLFLAISSFWMYKPNTKKFRRGLIFAGIGLILSIVLLLF